LKGATHTASSLIADSAHAEATGRVHVKVGRMDWDNHLLRLSDDTGELLVRWDQRVSLLGASGLQQVEAEIQLPRGYDDPNLPGEAGLMVALKWNDSFG
jgi:hypothetical protein